MLCTNMSSHVFGAYVLVAVFSLASTSCDNKNDANETQAQDTTPEAGFQETDFDFGKVTRGDDVSHTFIIKNIGHGQLKLLGTRSSCPCVMPHLSGTDIAPGQEGKLTLRLNTSRQKGKLLQTVTLKTNDPKHQSISFRIHGEVEVLAAFEPDLLSFGKVLKSSTKSTTIKIIGKKSQEMKPGQALSSNPDHITAELARQGQEWTMKVTIKTPEKEGRLAGIIRLQTGLDNPKEIKLRVIAQVSSDLVTDRTYAMFSKRQALAENKTSESKDQPVYIIHVRSLSNKPFKITGIRDPQGIVIGQAKLTKGGWKVELKLAKDSAKKRGEVLIDTDRKDQPTLPVKYIIRSATETERSLRPMLRTSREIKKPLMRVDPKDIPGLKNKGKIKLDQTVRRQPGKIKRLNTGGPKKYPPPPASSSLKSGTNSD